MMGSVQSRASRRVVPIALATFAILVMSLPLVAVAQTAASKLKSVEVSSLSGDRVRLNFGFDGKVPEHDSFTISDPARIVVDFPNTTSEVTQRFRRVDIGLIESVTVSQAGSRTRATVKLSRMSPYDLAAQGTALQLTMDAGGNVVAAAPAPTPAKDAAGVDVGVDFRRGAEGQGVVSMSVPSTAGNVDVREEGDRIIIDLPGVRLPTASPR